MVAAFSTLLGVSCGSSATPSESEPDVRPSTDPVSETDAADSTAPLTEPDVADSVASETGALRVGCASGPFFPVTALESAPPLIEHSSAPELAEGITPFLESGEGDFWPQDGYRVLEIVAEKNATVVHPGSDEFPGLRFMSADWTSQGWTWSGASIPGDCVLVAEPSDDGAAVVDWVLDPDAAPIGPATTVLELLATERDCASGQPMGDRLNEPEVTVTAEAVLIGLTTEPSAGDQTCQGNPSEPIQIELPEPLGQRRVSDARATELGDLQVLLTELIADEPASTGPDPANQDE